MQYFYGVLTLTCINVLSVLGLSLLTGFTGIFSFGHAAYMAIGAYTSAILTTRLNVPFIVSLLAVSVVCGVLSYLIGLPTLRLVGDYFAIAALGFGESVRSVSYTHLDVYKRQGAMLGVTIGIITVTSELIPLIEESARAIGISSKIVSIRAVDIPVLELDDKSRLIESFIRESIDSIREGAHVIIAGCTGMVGLAREVKNSLMARGYDVPIVDPQGAAMVCAEGLVRLSTYHSSLSYSCLLYTSRCV